MKLQNLAAILLRLVALYFLYTTILGLIKVYLQITTPDSSAYFTSLLFISLEVILPLIVFVWLWLFPNSVAQLIVKPSNNETIKPMASIDWLRILIISIGVYLFTMAILDTFYWISATLLTADEDAFNFLSEQKAAMMTTAAELIVGLLLISKNTWISQALLKINAPEAASKNNQIK